MEMVTKQSKQVEKVSDSVLILQNNRALNQLSRQDVSFFNSEFLDA